MQTQWKQRKGKRRKLFFFAFLFFSCASWESPYLLLPKSAKATSGSTIQNSARCRGESDFSALTWWWETRRKTKPKRKEARKKEQKKKEGTTKERRGRKKEKKRKNRKQQKKRRGQKTENNKRSKGENIKKKPKRGPKRVDFGHWTRKYFSL